MSLSNQILNRGRYKVTIADENGVDKEIQEYNNNGSFGELGMKTLEQQKLI